MAPTAPATIGRVVSLWRYPVKSLLGEKLEVSGVTERGLLGDRGYALIDGSNGSVISAKNPRKWPKLFFCEAAFTQPPRAGEKIPPVRITFPEGGSVSSEQSDVHQVLSKEFGHEVSLQSIAPAAPQIGMLSADDNGLVPSDDISEITIAEGAPQIGRASCRERV